MLFLLTDGIPEAMNQNGDLFGEAVLVEALVEARRQPLPEVVRRVINAVHHFVDGALPSDDITCLAVRYAATS
jgi:serine phosphatase RsbU (regulator of sigma subunit)